MKILVVLAHPEMQSMNGAMFQKAIATLKAEGHEVRTSDLYREVFNPVSGRHNFKSVLNDAFFKQQLEEVHAAKTGGFAEDIESEMQKVEWCDLMIWQFPLWWFTMPGILKGWVDRVFAMERFYGAGRFYGQGVFKGKKAMLSLTTGSGSPEEAYRAGGLHGDLSGILRPIHRGIFQFVGFEVLQPHIVYGPTRMTMEQREAALDLWGERLGRIFQEEEITVGAY